MTLGAFLRRLLGGPEQNLEKLEPQNIDYAYRIYWTKTAREWSIERRVQVAAALQEVIARPDFEKNMLERRFEVGALGDGLAHSGASLLALREVLDALEMDTAQEHVN